ncbi:MAG: hypothetical protein E4H14_01885 [Candidatus Thorarchaeota archaeon]|nr:MAG: hypothetical protein E4H14_01885 [Candidatus Thorarchaeota archaeon]
MLLQGMGIIIQTLVIITVSSLLLSTVCTLVFLLKYRVSNTAWIYALLATIAFFLASNIVVIFASMGNIVSISWATPLGIPGGYLLLGLAIHQYLQDKKKDSMFTESTEIEDYS